MHESKQHSKTSKSNSSIQKLPQHPKEPAKMSSPPLQQAFFVSITDNGNQGFGPELFLTTYGPNFPAPIGAGPFGNAIWQQTDPTDLLTYSLVSNPNPELEPLNPSETPTFTGQIITLQNVGVAAGAALTINLLVQGAEPQQVVKIVMDGLFPGTTKSVGSEGSTTPL
jgi:hypothetical protein